MDNIDLKYIKKHYGENFAKLCRELFPTILETPGALSKIISERFDPSPTLFEDISKIKSDFKTFVFGLYNLQLGEQIKKENKTAEQLFAEAGYILYPECKTEKDVQSFKKYYAPGEELCTFKLYRLETCRVWFAVKKYVDRIKREDFKEPFRQDEYGTSVISIQFTKEKNSTLSIKNRYNHVVHNPDATFGNNLDNIIPGLTNAFCKEYGIDLSYDFQNRLTFDGYVMSDNGKFYKSNVWDYTKNCCFCANNVVVDRVSGKTTIFDKSKYLLVDNYLFDFENKKIKCLLSCFNDDFAKSIGEIKTIHVSLDQNKNKVINITPVTGDDVQVVVNKSNQIIEYTNKNVKNIKNDFMYFCRHLSKINLPNVESVGDYFLDSNESLTELDMPKLKTTGEKFLAFNEKLSKLNLPKLENADNCFLNYNKGLTELNLPNLKSVGCCFLNKNTNIEKLNLPNLEKVGYDFLSGNNHLKAIDLPKLTEVGDWFLNSNENLEKLNIPNLKKVGKSFLYSNRKLSEIDLPKLRVVGNNFLAYNENLKKIHLPKLNKKDINHLYTNNIFLSNKNKKLYNVILEHTKTDTFN